MAGGRPPKWNSVEEIKSKIDAYFLSLTDDEGNYKKPPTITGLAIALGTNRQTLVNYEEKDEFFDTIKEAKSRCEQWVEENAMLGKANATFSIFNLKNNYSWKDQTQQDITTGGDKLQATIQIVKPNEHNIQTNNETISSMGVSE